MSKESCFEAEILEAYELERRSLQSHCFILSYAWPLDQSELEDAPFDEELNFLVRTAAGSGDAYEILENPFNSTKELYLLPALALRQGYGKLLPTRYHSLPAEFQQKILSEDSYYKSRFTPWIQLRGEEFPEGALEQKIWGLTQALEQLQISYFIQFDAPEWKLTLHIATEKIAKLNQLTELTVVKEGSREEN